MDRLERENQARQQLWGDTKGTLMSLGIPFYHQWNAAKESSRKIREGDTTLLQETPRFLYAAATALPSLASASFLLPLIPSLPFSFVARPLPAVTRFGYGLIDALFFPVQRLLMTRPCGQLYRATNRLGAPLAFASLLLSFVNLARSLVKYADDQVTGKAVLFSFCNDLLLTGGILLFAGFTLKANLKHRSGKGAETVLRFENPSTRQYSGGRLEKILSLRDLMFRSAAPAVSFYRHPAGFAVASQIHLDMDARMLRRTGFEQVVIKGGKHLQSAAQQGTMIIQHCHTQLPDFAATDLAARALGVDHAQFLKGDLAVLPVMRLVGRTRLAMRVIVADKNFGENADRMYAMFMHPYKGRGGKAFTEYAVWTRTNAGKHSMVGKSGTVFEYDATTGRIIERPNVDFGPDQEGRLWKPHWEAFARALQYARDYDEDFRVVRSVIRLKDFRNGAYRTVEIEYFEPVSVRPYVEQLCDVAWNERDAASRVLEQVARKFRNDDVEWIKATLLGDGYHTSYADQYYEFVRGKGGLFRAIGLGR